ncbi:DUF1761 domain-containing protein [Arcicella aquatica]|uniref:DUF1761 domain-containing protein n=1 Tax=Arcicella aquatica TaxID=217141 RepID=A0ABU5QIR9_9BACT|nr:DUF1761 domain-containing protein [Arcicella aquatica]MEA5256609.1 DUF1761 domain-containing protein [Arcicella aquatica]
MINQLANLNWMSVLIAFTLYCFEGALWFTLLFSKQYKISLGRENETLPNKPIFIIGPAICTLVVTIVSAILMYALNISTWAQMFEFSLLTGIGYLVANTFNIAINPNIPRPILYGIISGSYHLVGILITNSILFIMK